MNKTTILIGIALTLATLYIVNFTDWFKHKDIHVDYRISPASGAMVFYLDKAYPLASVEVVCTEDAKTNKYPHALWHLVAKPPAKPTKTFNYGSLIPGMKPEVATAVPESLEPGVDYSLLVQDGTGIKGEAIFQIH